MTNKCQSIGIFGRPLSIKRPTKKANSLVFFYLKVSTGVFSIWLIRLLLRLRVGRVGGHQTLCTNKNDKVRICPAEWGRCQSAHSLHTPTKSWHKRLINQNKWNHLCGFTVCTALNAFSFICSIFWCYRIWYMTLNMSCCLWFVIKELTLNSSVKTLFTDST